MMNGYTLVLVLIGTCWAVSQMFHLIDAIERPARSRRRRRR